MIKYIGFVYPEDYKEIFIIKFDDDNLLVNYKKEYRLYNKYFKKVYTYMGENPKINYPDLGVEISWTTLEEAQRYLIKKLFKE